MTDTIRSSWWIGTLNNPTTQDRQTFQNPPPRWLRIVKGQDEIGENGTLHIQFAVNTQQIRLSQLKQWQPRAHFEAARNPSAVINYCNKNATSVEGTQFEFNYIKDNETLTMAQVMRKIAERVDEEWVRVRLRPPQIVPSKLPTPEDVYKMEYWNIINMMLLENENLIALLTQPQYERSWVKTRKTWISLVEADRQTEIEITPVNEIVEQ